jgi:hypothetical protein
LISVDARPLSINAKIISTRSILLMALDELCTSLEDATDAPKCTIPEIGIPSKAAAYQLLVIKMLDGNPLLNLAS